MNFEKPSVVLCEDDKSALDLYNILISIYPQDNLLFSCTTLPLVMKNLVKKYIRKIISINKTSKAKYNNYQLQ